MATKCARYNSSRTFPSTRTCILKPRIARSRSHVLVVDVVMVVVVVVVVLVVVVVVGAFVFSVVLARTVVLVRVCLPLFWFAVAVTTPFRCLALPCRVARALPSRSPRGVYAAALPCRVVAALASTDRTI